jgi:hypothetical protein
MIGLRGRDEYFIRVNTATLTQLFCRHKTFHMMKQKAEIVFEVEETIVLRQGEQVGSEFCPQCRIVSAMIAPRAIAIFSGAKEREIFRLIEAGEIHFVEADGVRVCLSCLNRYGSECRIARRTCETQRPQPRGPNRYDSE